MHSKPRSEYNYEAGFTDIGVKIPKHVCMSGRDSHTTALHVFFSGQWQSVPGAAWLVPEQNGEVPAAPPGQLGSRLGTVGGGMATGH